MSKQVTWFRFTLLVVLFLFLWIGAYRILFKHGPISQHDAMAQFEGESR